MHEKKEVQSINMEKELVARARESPTDSVKHDSCIEEVLFQTTAFRSQSGIEKRIFHDRQINDRIYF